MRRQYTTLLVIVILFGLVIWLNLPSNPGISIGSFYRSMQTVLGLDLRGGVQVLLEADTAQPRSTLNPWKTLGKFWKTAPMRLGFRKINSRLLANAASSVNFPA